MTEEVQTPEQDPAETPIETPEQKKSRQMSFTVGDDGVIRADFGTGLDPLYLNVTDVPEALQAAAMTEGLISRARGYTSKLQDDARTPTALREQIAKAFDNLKAGVWKVERAASETDYSLEIQAAHLFRFMRAKAENKDYTESLADVATAFAALTDDQKKKLKSVPRYQLALAEVKEKAVAAKRAKLQAKLDAEGDDAGF